MEKPLYHDGLSKQRIMTQHSVSGESQTSNPSIPRSDSICHFYRLIWESLSIQKWPLFSQFHIFLSPRFYLKSEGGIVIASVRPLCYLLLNHWTKLNQIWCVSYSHNGARKVKFFSSPAHWGPGEGSKGQISFNFNYKVNFKDFYSKLCVCSQGVKKIFFKTWSCGISNRRG